MAGDDRNFLFEYMVSAALALKPSLFLMENVPGMQSARHENLSFLELAAQKLQQKGKYRTAIWKLNASAFGVPQDRIRYFLVASRLRSLPASPHDDYQDMHRLDFDVDALPPITLDEAIFDLPPRDAGAGTAVERQEHPEEIRGGDSRFSASPVPHEVRSDPEVATAFQSHSSIQQSQGSGAICVAKAR
jgi:DNA (cytosine-5)-methyltransferase 1